MPVIAEKVAPPSLSILEGLLSSQEHRQKALQVLANHGLLFITTGNENYGIGGIFFNIDDLQAVNRVIDIKTGSDKKRQAMFGIMTPNETFFELADLKYTLDISHAPPVFIRVAVKQPHNLPQWAYSVDQDPTTHIVQCFLSDTTPDFSDLVTEAAEKNIRIGGTSLNITGAGNIKTNSDAIEFCRSKGAKTDMWLHTTHPFTGVSHTIINLDSNTPTAKVFRQGGVHHTIISERLKIEITQQD